MARQPTQIPATLVPLSPSLDAVVVDKRTCLLVRGREAFRLSWSEFERLRAYAAAQETTE